MTAKTAYHFKFQIVDATTGEIVECDWCSMPDTDPVGFVSNVIDVHVAQMLRNWRNFARAEYEACNYPVPA